MSIKKTVIVIIFCLWVDKFWSQCTVGNNPFHVIYPGAIDTDYVSQEIEYLCGPNSTLNFLYSQAGNAQCVACLNSNCTLNLGAQVVGGHIVWLKAGATLNVLQGCSQISLTYEPGAIVNNPFNISIISTTCQSIGFPPVNCVPTALNHSDKKNTFTFCYPNPTSATLNIELKFPSKITLFSSSGILLSVDESKEVIREVSLLEYEPGLYFIKIESDLSNEWIRIIKF